MVTVLMPAYNAERYVAEAIASILDQTFSDFEFVIVDDASTDRTAEIVRSFADERIRYTRNSRNLRIAASLNQGLDISRGTFIARMDSDDVAMATRLERQVSFMLDNPDVALVGTSMKLIDGDGRGRGKAVAVSEPNLLRWRQHFSNQIFHPTVMFRHSTVKELGLQYGSVPAWALRNGAIRAVDHLSEDYLLFGLLALRATVTNVPDILHLYRVHSGSISGSNEHAQLSMACSVAGLLFQLVLGREVSPDLVRLVYFTRPQTAGEDDIEAACQIIDDALDTHLRQYAIPVRTAAALRRDAAARQRVLRSSRTSVPCRLAKLGSGPAWPRDREEARLLVRSVVSENEIECFKRFRKTLFERFSAPTKH